ncbi:pro-resilin-like [Palaemon carinicauda]|uniref:pro-resilin-like n=1 Tax=Palaemon carinicauda TaxID=392227 RepID=UPI0035B6205D
MSVLYRAKRGYSAERLFCKNVPVRPLGVKGAKTALACTCDEKRRKVLLLSFACALTSAMPRPDQGSQGHKKASGGSAVSGHNKQSLNANNFHHASSVGGFQTPSSGGFHGEGTPTFPGGDGKRHFGGGILYTGLPSPGQHVASPSTFHGTPNAHNFGYEVSDSLLGNKHGHTGYSDGETTKGEYRVLLPDGRTQVVTYSADPKSGFMARVTYEGEAKPYSPPQRSHQHTESNQYPSGLAYSQ